jgi:cytidylate kinase
MNKIIIAIDGYSACGKSTTARAVATKLGYTYVDSGAMYRTVTYYLIKNNISFTDIGVISNALEKLRITFRMDKQGNPVTCLNGESVEEEIREMEVSENVSAVAAISEVRKAMVRIQQKLGEGKGIVMDGRDIGTVVFPEAELKIFMTAYPKIRAKRRLKELEAKGVLASMKEVLKNVQQRDFKDTSRADSPLRKADDAKELDNSFMTFKEQVNKIIELAEEISNR